MEKEYLITSFKKTFSEIAVKLIRPNFRFPNGGASDRIVLKAITDLESKTGGVSGSRIVDYIVCSAYVFRNRGEYWSIRTVFGPKSIERFDTDKGRRHYEDEWLRSAGITRSKLLSNFRDKSEHPHSKYIYIDAEESTKSRLMNTEPGFSVCQTSTLGWSPLSPTCGACHYVERCQRETAKKFPELYRLRMESGTNIR